MNFGERLKKIRLEKKLTQEQVAQIINVGRPTISGYETKNIYPDYEKLASLSKLFNCTTDYLLGLTNNPNHYNDIQLSLFNNIKGLLESDSIINKDTELTSIQAEKILNELETSLQVIKLLKRINS